MTEILLGTALLTVLVLALTGLVIGARAVFLPAIPVIITVNGRDTVPGTTGDKLLSILNRADIPVPSACAGAGTCGLCKVIVVDGAGESLPIERGRLSRSEISRGVRLACQVVVRNALAVEVPPDILAAESYECTVVSNTMLAPLISELTLGLPDTRSFTFRAGSFVQVTAPAYSLDFTAIDVAEAFKPMWSRIGWQDLKASNAKPAARAYSIANTPSDRDRIVLDIRLAVPPPGAGEEVSPGIVSSYLFGLKPGDVVEVSGPFGEFRATDSDREMVFIGGGVGMAPLRAIIFDQLESVRTKRKISYWYGARSLADVFYKEDFDRLAREHTNFTWTIALSDPAPGTDWRGPVGFIHDIVFQSCLRDHPTPEACEYYLCGPPLMINAVLAMLEDLGVEESMIFNDDFGS